jgi:hypothetical protein
MEFILLATSSIYERLTNNHIALIIYQTLLEAVENDLDLDSLYTISVQNIFKSVVEQGCKDTLSCVILFFESFVVLWEQKNIEAIKYKIKNLAERVYIHQSERYYNYLKKIFIDDDIVSRLESRSVIINNNINNNNNNNINIIRETKFYCCGIFGSTK